MTDVFYTRNNSGGQSKVPVNQRHSRQTGIRDDDSSGLSEPNDGPRKPGQGQPNISQLSSLQNQLGNRNNSDIKHADTSDSTDSETYSKRRRIKTKHELDKMKSSSNNSLLTESGNALDLSVKSGHSKSMNGSIEAKPPKGPVPTNSQTLPSSKHQMSRQYSADGSLSNSQRIDSSKPLNLSASFDANSRFSSEVRAQANQLNVNSQNMNQVQPSVNGTATSEKSGLTREMSMSSHSSSQSDLDREVTEGIAVVKKGHVVYHWAMIQLCMSQEMERFMQDIVSY